jgi:hypothetical protein
MREHEPMTQAALRPWSARAINLPEHADNPIHTDPLSPSFHHPGFAVIVGNQ